MVDLKDIHHGTRLLVVSERTGGMTSSGKMDKWLGQVVTCDYVTGQTILIEEDRGDCPFHDIHGNRWYWGVWMFECIVDDNQADFEAPNFNEIGVLLYG